MSFLKQEWWMEVSVGVLKLNKCKDSAASAAHLGVFGLFSLEGEGDEADIHLTGDGEGT